MRFAPVLAALAVVAGCGAPEPVPAKVSGVVLFRGEPVGGGTVTFVAADGEPFTSPIAADGVYTFRGLPPGAYAVAVETESVKRAGAAWKAWKQADAAWRAQGQLGEFGPRTPRESYAVYAPIPGRYRHPARSGLAVSLAGGMNTHNFDLD